MSLKNTLFVACSWSLLGMAWVFAVLHVAPPLFHAANAQANLHEAKQREEIFIEYGAVIVRGDPAAPPTWPIWIIYGVGFAAGFATEYPYWTIVAGTGCMIWGYLLTTKLMQRYRNSVGRKGFQKPNPLGAAFQKV